MRHSLWLQIAVCVLMMSSAVCAYSREKSINLNRFSAVTHCNQDQISKWNCKICNKGQSLYNISYLYNQPLNIMAYTGYWPSQYTIVVSFRGTVDIRNWIEDFDYKQIAYPMCKGCQIHEGFYVAYKSLVSQLVPAIQAYQAQYPGIKMIVTGSSLGGALAQVAAIELQNTFGIVTELHCFGSPRIGNANLAQYLKLRIPEIYRVVHNNDLVPHVPLQSQGYHHAPYEVLYDSAMQSYKICDESGEDPTCSDQNEGNYARFSIPDHLNYWYKPVVEDVCTPEI